ncbi:Small auxin-up RNA protein [Dioscorea alata]|uniref:Small auxin-up RNA protein n=1 Tax=Dioscorea alata TaxID=55571 RepID=A0ACB7VZU5_DIOAL|nr:Small auxin-up RNA protein [Dioscorea alata]
MKMVSAMKLARIAKILGAHKQFRHQRLIGNSDENHQGIITPVGFLPVYVGEEKERFVIPTAFLAHPLFKMLLEKAYMEYGFDQRSGLSLPCTVSIFQQVVSAVKCHHGQFDLENLVQELEN